MATNSEHKSNYFKCRQDGNSEEETAVAIRCGNDYGLSTKRKNALLLIDYQPITTLLKENSPFMTLGSSNDHLELKN